MGGMFTFRYLLLNPPCSYLSGKKSIEEQGVRFYITPHPMNVGRGRFTHSVALFILQANRRGERKNRGLVCLQMPKPNP